MTHEKIAAFLPSGAYDVTVTDFVARWKNPNSHAAKGYHSDSRFLAGLFLEALRDELPELKKWEVLNYDHEPATAWNDRACMTDGAAKIWASTRGYGVHAFTKVEFQGYALAANGKHSSKSVEMKAALSRPVAAIAKDLARRVLPHLDAAKAEAVAKAKAESDTIAEIKKKTEQLQKRYPKLRIIGDAAAARIRIETKYGAGLHLDAYACKDSRSGVWSLTSNGGRAIGADDIDSQAGRDLLRIINTY